MVNEWYKDYAKIQRRTPAGQGGAAWAAYLQQKNATEKNYQNAFSQVDSIATAEGVQAERPSIHSGLSTAQYEEQLNKYLANVNTGVFKRDVTNTLKDVQKQGQASGVNVALPVVDNLTPENAQAEIDKYVNTVNAHVYAKSAVTACNDLAVQAQAYGVTIATPKVPTTMTQAEAQNLINNYQSQVNSLLLTKSTKDSIDGVAAQAKSYGVQVSAPVVPAGISQQTANELVNKYVAQVNTAVLVKSTRTALLDIQSQARNYGLTVPIPAISGTITEAAANALIDRYVADVNAQLSATPETASVSETSGLRTAAKSNNLLMTTGLQTDAKSNTNLVGSSGLKTSAKVNANLVGASLATDAKINADLVALSELQISTKTNTQLVGAEPIHYVGYDTLGRETKLTEKQYKQVIEAAQKHASWEKSWDVIPEQVANSGADWWINKDGQFEYVPVTAGDKALLAKINTTRDSPRSTLILGAAPSAAYEKKWYSTGGGNRGKGESSVKIRDATGAVTKSFDYDSVNRAKVGSGDIKLAAIKASSPAINANASAKSNTPQTIKAVTITAKEAAAIEAAAHPGQIKLKDGSWINQIERKGNSVEKEAAVVYASKADYNAALANVNKIAQEAKQARVNFKDIKLANGKIIDPVQKIGGTGVGEGPVTIFKADKVTGKITARSGTAGEYNQSLKAAEKIAAIKVTANTDKATAKAIIDARDYVAARKLEPVTTMVGADFATMISLGEKTSKKPGANKVLGSVTQFKTVEQQKQAKVDENVAKALEEARKINPKGSKEYFEGVANVARRSQLSTKEIMKEDLARANKQIGEKVTTLIVNEFIKVTEARDKALAGTSITINDKGKIAISKKGKESITGVTFNAKDTHRDIIKGSAVLSGYNKFINDGLEDIKTKPVNVAAEVGLIYASGAAFGAALGGAKAIVNPRLAKTVGTIAGKTGSKAIEKLAVTGSKYAIDAAAIGLPVVYTAGRDIAYFNSKDYKTLTDIEKDVVKTDYVAGLFKTGAELAVAAPGFNKGAKVAESAVAKFKTSRLAAPKVKKVSDLENALPSEFDVTNVAKYAQKQVPKTTAEKIINLKKQVKALEAKGRAVDKPKIRALKREINSAENSAKNRNIVADMKPKNYADIKTTAEDQFFDKTLAELRDMQKFADDYAGPLKVTRATESGLESALSKLTPYDKSAIKQIKAGKLELPKSTRAQYAKESPDAVKARASQVSKAGAKKAKVISKNLSKKLNIRKSAKGLKPQFDRFRYEKDLKAALEDRNRKVSSKSLKDGEFDAELSAIKDKAFDARVKELEADRAFDTRLAELKDMKTFADNYMKEGKYKPANRDIQISEAQAENALLKLTPGEKLEIKAINAGTTAKKMIGDRAKTNKKAHDIANKGLQDAAKKKSNAKKLDTVIKKAKTTVKTAPSRVKTSVVKAKQSVTDKLKKSKSLEHDNAKQVLKGAKKHNQFKNTPKDITDVVGFRKSQSARDHLTFKDIAEYKATNPKLKKVGVKPRKVKIDEYNFAKNAEELVRANNKIKAQNKAKSITDKEFDAELENLKVRDFDKRLEDLKLKQETKAIMTEAEAEAAVARVTKSIDDIVTGKVKLDKKLEGAESKEVLKSEDKFAAAKKRTQIRNAEIQKSYGEGGAEVNSGNLKLMQKVEAKVEAKVKPEIATKARQRMKTKQREKALEARRKARAEAKIKTREATKAKTLKRQKAGAFAKTAKKPEFEKSASKAMSKPVYYTKGIAAEDTEYQQLKYPNGALAVVAMIRNVEHTINQYSTASRIPTSIDTKPITRPVNRMVTKPQIDQKSITRVDTTSRTAVKVDTETATAVKPIVDEIVKVVPMQKTTVVNTFVVTDGRSLKQGVPFPAKKHLKSASKSQKRRTSKEKLSRKIRNQLGSLDTLF